MTLNNWTDFLFLFHALQTTLEHTVRPTMRPCGIIHCSENRRHFKDSEGDRRQKNIVSIDPVRIAKTTIPRTRQPILDICTCAYRLRRRVSLCFSRVRRPHGTVVRERCRCSVGSLSRRRPALAVIVVVWDLRFRDERTTDTVGKRWERERSMLAVDTAPETADSANEQR